MRPAVVLLLLPLSCAAAVHSAVRDDAQIAASGAIAGFTSPTAVKAIDAETVSIVASARDEALGPETQKRLQAILQAALDTFSAALITELAATRDSVFDAKLRDEITQLIRASLDEAFGPTTLAEVGALREQATGAPLRANVTAAIDEAAPHIAAAIQIALAPVKADVEAEAKTVERLTIAIAGLVTALLVLGVFVLVEARRHRASLERILEAKAKS